MKYNILWIDDEHEGLSGFIGEAKLNDIILYPFKSLNGGMAELKRNYPFYDGVLLDAKIFENEGDIAGTEDTINVHRAKDQLAQLDKKFDIFVLTGQAEAFDDKTFNKAFSNVYVKGSDEDTERLFEDLKASADKQKDTQIRHEFSRVFEVCTNDYIGSRAGEDLLTLLKVGDDSIDTNHYFSSIRKVIEDLFIAFNKFELLPYEFIYNDKGNFGVRLTATSKFLLGKNHKKEYFEELGYWHKDETHLPVHIANQIRSILHITQPASHRSGVDNHVSLVKTPYLYKATLYQLLDVVTWFKIYIDSKPKPKKKNWERIRP